MLIHMSTWTVLKDLVKKNYLIKNVFAGLWKMEQLVTMVKKLYGLITDEKYLTSIKTWNEFNMKNMGEYHDHYFKKCFVISWWLLKSFLSRV